jgi:hypothetical protein
MCLRVEAINMLNFLLTNLLQRLFLEQKIVKEQKMTSIVENYMRKI